MGEEKLDNGVDGGKVKYDLGKPKKNLRLIILLAVLALTAIGAAGAWYYLGGKDKKSESTFTTSTKTDIATDETADWKTYTNSTHGLSFKYPKNWYAFSNNSQYENMCQAEFKLESPTNEFSASNPCVLFDFVANVTNINGFCTKGGCVGIDLKAIENPADRQTIGIQTMSKSEFDRINQEYSSKAKAEDITKDPVKISFYRIPKIGDNFPFDAALWSKDNKYYVMATGTETGTEDEEISVFTKMIQTIQFTK